MQLWSIKKSEINNYFELKTPSEIFRNNPELLENNSVKELVSEYEEVCDALIDLQQVSEMSKEKYLKILVREIRESISMELKRDLEAERFGESERVNFKNAVENLQSYIADYCREHKIYL
ncbi:MAG TPA: hypothetical protein DDZ79_03670 [Aequorivita sp.]|nr:hypothetical protein [Aequorivita sp.]